MNRLVFHKLTGYPSVSQHDYFGIGTFSFFTVRDEANSCRDNSQTHYRKCSQHIPGLDWRYINQ